MKRTISSLGLVILVMVPQLVAAQGGEEALTNEDIVALTEAGLPTSVIVAKIEATRSDFDTTVEQLVALAGAGVEAAVIEAMTKAGSAGSQRREEPPRPVVVQPTVSGSPPGQRAPGTRVPATGNAFRDVLRAGGEGPEMVVVPAGRFRMGCVSGLDCFDDEKPVHEVTMPRAFALSVHEVTFEDYDRFTYPNKVDDESWGRGRRPVIYVSWNDAKEYVAWLSSQTGAEYRLPSEAEWEYAARAGTATKYSWGNEIGANRANCDNDGCGDRWEYTAPVGSFAPNAFGLYDMHGNVWEWVEDCWNGSYSGAPSDGSAWLRGDCAVRVVRGGSWDDLAWLLRAALPLRLSTGDRYGTLGFRVARTLTP